MKRRYYLVIFVILFGFSLYGIIHAIVSNAPQINQQPSNSLSPDSMAPTPAQQSSDIVVSNPTNGQTIDSPLVVKGNARGSWYFEGSFPVQLFSEDGTLVASGPATAQGDWMTADYVPFVATLKFSTASTNPKTLTKGTLQLKKDNPSGNPQFDNSVLIKVQW